MPRGHSCACRARLCACAVHAARCRRQSPNWHGATGAAHRSRAAHMHPAGSAVPGAVPSGYRMWHPYAGHVPRAHAKLGIWALQPARTRRQRSCTRRGALWVYALSLLRMYTLFLSNVSSSSSSTYILAAAVLAFARLLLRVRSTANKQNSLLFNSEYTDSEFRFSYFLHVMYSSPSLIAPIQLRPFSPRQVLNPFTTSQTMNGSVSFTHSAPMRSPGFTFWLRSMPCKVEIKALGVWAGLHTSFEVSLFGTIPPECRNFTSQVRTLLTRAVPNMHSEKCNLSQFLQVRHAYSRHLMYPGCRMSHHKCPIVATPFPAWSFKVLISAREDRGGISLFFA